MNSKQGAIAPPTGSVWPLDRVMPAFYGRLPVETTSDRNARHSVDLPTPIQLFRYPETT